MEAVLRRIEEAGRAIADATRADIRVEKDRGGRFPYLTFRAFGSVPPNVPTVDDGATWTAIGTDRSSSSDGL
jgi:hypothetical protein